MSRHHHITRIISHSTVLPTLVIILRLLLIANITVADPDTTVTFVACNENTWATDDPYRDSVFFCLDDLVSNTPDEQNYAYSTNATNEGTTAYGTAACNIRLSVADCYFCLDEAVIQMSNRCTYAIGAEIEMVDCKMRYEKYPIS